MEGILLTGLPHARVSKCHKLMGVRLRKIFLTLRNIFRFVHVSVGLRYFRVPKNWFRKLKFFRTGPGTAKKFKSVLEPNPEPLKSLSQL